MGGPIKNRPAQSGRTGVVSYGVNQCLLCCLKLSVSIRVREPRCDDHVWHDAILFEQLSVDFQTQDWNLEQSVLSYIESAGLLVPPIAFLPSKEEDTRSRKPSQPGVQGDSETKRVNGAVRSRLFCLV